METPHAVVLNLRFFSEEDSNPPTHNIKVWNYGLVSRPAGWTMSCCALCNEWCI